ncbi:MAG: GNAT family N-acetyltransferase [Candidatus Heimdallarchaeota archaeon]|nr:GNAT family N-acetyltransferase [Candidatus Heimdallarchaeota archaeon]MCK4954379.1 GNAT family N-acetyltransferase [Candidatus Heimdallarchaeota archaeon]
MMLNHIRDIEKSEELKQILQNFYGEHISIQEFIESMIVSKNAKISLIQHKEKNIGYIVWLIEKEKEEGEEGGKIIKAFVIDDMVFLPKYQKMENAKELISELDKHAKEQGCTLIEITLPSPSFWLIPIFIQEGDYSSSVLRVSKELQKKTEFVQIYNVVIKGLKPELTEVMVSRNEEYHLEIIEEPMDYRRIIEEGYNPEIVSMIFYVEDEKMEEKLNQINEIAEWQEYSFSLVKNL